MKLGERKTIDDKEYVAVYHFRDSCKRCALQHSGICKELYNKTKCRTQENGRLQEEIVWIEVKK
ncbi:MAG: hypothetical protein GY707_05685 [Desulfobacteraceae bacterium]|nr:hypothetical protein [Desulfobacteraceae bacterium]